MQFDNVLEIVVVKFEKTSNDVFTAKKTLLIVFFILLSDKLYFIEFSDKLSAQFFAHSKL